MYIYIQRYMVVAPYPTRLPSNLAFLACLADVETCMHVGMIRVSGKLFDIDTCLLLPFRFLESIGVPEAYPEQRHDVKMPSTITSSVQTRLGMSVRLNHQSPTQAQEHLTPI